MIPIQLIAITFSLIALFFTYIHYRKKDFEKKEMIAWAVIWIAFMGVAIFPQAVSPYVQELGFSRLMDFIVMIAFVVSFIVLLHNYIVVHCLERRIEDLVRQLALKDLEKERKEKSQK